MMLVPGCQADEISNKVKLAPRATIFQCGSPRALAIRGAWEDSVNNSGTSPRVKLTKETWNATALRRSTHLNMCEEEVDRRDTRVEHDFSSGVNILR